MNCHNGEEYLHEAIKSVYEQTYQNWEIIFWDNASTDQSKKIALSFDKKVKYFLSQQKSSLGEARNLALHEANGRYICFLDCDDLYLPNKLQRQVKLMEEGGFPLSYSSAEIIDGNGNKIRNFPAKNNSGDILDKLLVHYEINMQSVILRNSFLIKEELNFLTSMQYCPDHNLFLKIAANNEIGVDQNYLVKYRVIANSLSSKTMYLAGSEVRLTLDEISHKYPQLKLTLKEKFRLAYAKCSYYDCIAFIYGQQYKEARKLLFPIISMRYEYLGLYLLLLLHFPSKLILRLLNRYV